MHMRKPRWLFVAVILLLSFQSSFAQNRDITGKITDDKGNPIANASIQIKGTSTGTVSQSDGSYKITVPASAKTLVFSAVDMATKDVSIGSQSLMNIVLPFADKSLQEVV